MNETNQLEILEFIKQAESLYTLEKYNEAIDYYKKANDVDRMVVQPYIGICACYIMLDNYEAAKEELNKALLADKAYGEVYFHLANIAVIEGNYDEAKQQYSIAANNGFEEPELYMNMSSMYETIGDIDNAINCLTKAISKDNYLAEAKLRKAELFMIKEQKAEALQILNDLILSNPDLFEGYHYKYAILMDDGKLDEACDVLNTAQELFPDDNGFKYDRIRYFSAKKEYDKALALADEIVNDSNDEEFDAVALEKAKVYIAMGKNYEASETLEKIHNEMALEEAVYLLCNIYFDGDKYDKVINACNKIIRDDSPRTTMYFHAVYYRALSMQNIGRKSDAKAEFERIIRELRIACLENPQQIDFYIFRALCYKAMKDYDKAFEMVDYILAISDDIAEAYIVRSELYKDINEPQKAEADRLTAISKSEVLSQILK